MTTVLGKLSNKSKSNLIVQDFDSACPNRNIFVVGGPGSFKSAGYVIPNVIIKNQQSIVVTDPSGEVFEKTANIKKAQGYDVRVVNFKNFLASDRQNFFDFIERDSDASIVSELVIKSSGDSRMMRDVWFKASVGLLNALILYARYEFEPKKRNMENIINFVIQNQPKEDQEGSAELDKRFDELEDGHPAKNMYKFGFDVSEERTRASILLTFVSDLRNYLDQDIKEFSSDSDFDLKDVGKSKTIIYVMLPVLGNVNQSLSSLFFSQMFEQLYRLGDDNGAKLPYPVDFILDEFPNIGVIPDYEETLATCRKYGIGISTIVQSISQLVDKYNRDKANAIIGNHAIILCLGNVNNDTAKYIRDELGNTTVEFETSSEGSSKGSKDSRSRSSNKNISYSSRALLNTDEIANMDQEKAILITKNRNPRIINKIAYFKMFGELVDKLIAKQNDYKRSKNESMIQKHKLLEEEWNAKKEKEKAKKVEQEKIKLEEKQKEEEYKKLREEERVKAKVISQLENEFIKEMNNDDKEQELSNDNELEEQIDVEDEVSENEFPFDDIDVNKTEDEDNSVLAMINENEDKDN